MHFVLGHRIDQIAHAFGRVGRVLAVRVLVDQRLERRERFTRCTRIALGRVLRVHEAEEPELIVEIDQATQVVHVVDLGVVRVQLDEALDRCQRLRLVSRLVVGVRHFHLRLCCVHAEWEVGFEPVEQRDCGFVVPTCHLFARLSV